MTELIIIAALYVLGAVLMRELIRNDLHPAKKAAMCAFWPAVAVFLIFVTIDE